MEDCDFEMLLRDTRECVRGLTPARAIGSMISGYMGSSGTFDDAIGEFAVEYADRNQRNYRAFVRTVREERVKAVVES